MTTPITVPAPFLYNAELIEWRDVDTGLWRVDRGDRDYSTWPVRLAGCAGRELTDPGGPEALAEIQRRVPAGTRGVLLTLKPDKFGDRKLARVIYQAADRQLHDLAVELIQDGWLAPWNGRGPQPKPPWPRRARP